MNKHITATLRTYDRNSSRSKTILSSPSSLRSMDSGFSDSNESGSETQPPPLLPRAIPKSELTTSGPKAVKTPVALVPNKAASPVLNLNASDGETDILRCRNMVVALKSDEICTSFCENTEIAKSFSLPQNNLHPHNIGAEPTDQQLSRLRSKKPITALKHNSICVSGRSLSNLRATQSEPPPLPPRQNCHRNQEASKLRARGGSSRQQHKLTVFSKAPAVSGCEQSHANVLDQSQTKTYVASIDRSSRRRWLMDIRWTEDSEHSSLLYSTYLPASSDSRSVTGEPSGRGTSEGTAAAGITLSGANTSSFTAVFAESWSDSTATTPLSGHSKIRQLLSSQQHLQNRLQLVIRCIREGRRSDALAKTEVLRQCLHALASAHAPITTSAHFRLIADLDHRLINTVKHLAVPSFDQVDVDHLVLNMNQTAALLSQLIGSLIETTAEILVEGVDPSYKQVNQCLKNVLWLIRTDSEMIRLLIGRDIIGRLTRLVLPESRDQKNRRDVLRFAMVTLALLLSQAESIREMEKASTMDRLMLLLRRNHELTHPQADSCHLPPHHQPLTSSELLACLHVLCQATRPRVGTIHRLQGIDEHVDQMIELLTVLYTTCSGDFRQLSVTILSNLCLMNLELADLMVRHRVLPILISSVLDNTIDLPTQLQISTVLAAMASIDPCRQHMAGDSGRAVQALLLLLGSTCLAHSSRPEAPPSAAVNGEEPERPTLNATAVFPPEPLQRRTTPELNGRDSRWSPPMRSRKHIKLASPPTGIRKKLPGDLSKSERDELNKDIHHSSTSRSSSNSSTETTYQENHHQVKSHSTGSVPTPSSGAAEQYTAGDRSVPPPPRHRVQDSPGGRICTCAVQHRAAVALCRLCSDKRVVRLIVLPSGVKNAHHGVDHDASGGIATLVRRCRIPPHSQDARAAILACLSALRRIASVCGMEVFSTADADELIRPPLMDSVLICTSREHYV